MLLFCACSERCLQSYLLPALGGRRLSNAGGPQTEQCANLAEYDSLNSHTIENRIQSISIDSTVRSEPDAFECHQISATESRVVEFCFDFQAEHKHRSVCSDVLFVADGSSDCRIPERLCEPLGHRPPPLAGLGPHKPNHRRSLADKITRPPELKALQKGQTIHRIVCRDKLPISIVCDGRRASDSLKS